MQGGDISNAVSPRCLYVFEGLIATAPGGVKSSVATKVDERLHRWDRIIHRMDFDPTVTQLLWDLVWRHGIRFDVVTYLYDVSFATALFQHLDSELGMPLSHVLWYPSPQALANGLAVMPDVARVFDANQQNALAYGGRGRYVRDLHRDLQI
jgi:hypothetical protein